MGRRRALASLSSRTAYVRRRLSALGLENVMFEADSVAVAVRLLLLDAHETGRVVDTAVHRVLCYLRIRPHRSVSNLSASEADAASVPPAASGCGPEAEPSTSPRW